MADKSNNPVKYGEVISKCWEDEAYRKRFVEEPESVLTEAGFVVEEGVTYKVVEQPKMVKYIVLPHEGTKDAVQSITKALLNRVEEKDTIIPEGAEVRIIQNTEDIRYMVLPASPKTLTKQELAAAAGGNGTATEVTVYVVATQVANIVSDYATTITTTIDSNMTTVYSAVVSQVVVLI